MGTPTVTTPQHVTTRTKPNHNFYTTVITKFFCTKMGSSPSRRQQRQLAASLSSHKMTEVFQRQLKPTIRTKMSMAIELIRQRDPQTADRIVKLTVEILSDCQSNGGKDVVDSTRRKWREVTKLIRQDREKQSPMDSFALKLINATK